VGAGGTFGPKVYLLDNAGALPPVRTSLAGMSSKSGGTLGTVATIVAGSATPGQVTMAWRERAANEKHPGPIFPDGSLGLLSDVLQLSRPVNSPLDPILLDMTYDPNALSPPYPTQTSFIHVSYMPDLGGVWTNAGNPAKEQVPGTLPGYTTDAELAAHLGEWGIYTANSVSHAWVITDHSSQFAVTPEPGTLLLLGMGALALVPFIRRRKTA
jgi:hypothetical protein